MAEASNPAIQAAQRRTTLAILSARERAGKITRVQYDKLAKKARTEQQR